VEEREGMVAMVVVGMADTLVEMAALVVVRLCPTCFHVQEKCFGVA